MGQKVNPHAFCPLFVHYIKKYISNFRFFLQIRPPF